MLSLKIFCGIGFQNQYLNDKIQFFMPNPSFQRVAARVAIPVLMAGIS